MSGISHFTPYYASRIQEWVSADFVYEEFDGTSGDGPYFVETSTLAKPGGQLWEYWEKAYRSGGCSAGVVNDGKDYYGVPDCYDAAVEEGPGASFVTATDEYGHWKEVAGGNSGVPYQFRMEPEMAYSMWGGEIRFISTSCTFNIRDDRSWTQFYTGITPYNMKDTLTSIYRLQPGEVVDGNGTPLDFEGVAAVWPEVTPGVQGEVVTGALKIGLHDVQAVFEQQPKVYMGPKSPNILEPYPDQLYAGEFIQPDWTWSSLFRVYKVTRAMMEDPYKPAGWASDGGVHLLTISVDCEQLSNNASGYMDYSTTEWIYRAHDTHNPFTFSVSYPGPQPDRWEVNGDGGDVAVWDDIWDQSDIYDDGTHHTFSIVVVPEWEWSAPEEIAPGFYGNDSISEFQTLIEVDAQITYDVQLPDFRYWITWAGLPDPTPSPPVPQPFWLLTKGDSDTGEWIE